MPSQEDYLDSLLKDLGNQGEEMNQQDVPADMDDLSMFAKDVAADMGDLFGSTDVQDDAELKEIHELLQKADNGEPIIENKGLLPEAFDVPETEIPEAEIREAETAEHEKEEAPSFVQATDKKAEKRARREARKAERKAKKEAGKAAKLQKEQDLEAETVVPQGMEDFESLLEQPADSFSDAFFDNASAEELSSVPDLDTISALDTIEHEEAKTSKKSFWEKALDFFTEEDEEESEAQDEIKLSEENKGILKDMDKEKSQKTKKAKKKKKAEGRQTEDEEISPEQAADKKKIRKEKRKKEKANRKQETDSEVLQAAEKRFSMKRILPIALICASFGAAVIILAYLSAGFAVKREARRAYYSEDYLTCYQNLFGKELNESEQVMLHKSESILKIRLWMREYRLFAKAGLEAEALDILIQSVEDYPVLLEFAGKWNAAEAVAEEYASLLSVLSEKYGLTEEQAKEIAAIPDDTEYTKTVLSIVEGTGYTEAQRDFTEQEKQAAMETDAPDRLPEEAFPDVTFIDNNTP